nr:MAG TPA: hypothetical protein [Bacteriophage sp.]
MSIIISIFISNSTFISHCVISCYTITYIFNNLLSV